MVKELNRGKEKFYLCEACGFGYKDIEIAQKCENYCKKHNSCSTQITKLSVLR